MECRDKLVPLVKNLSGRRDKPKLPRHILQAIRENKVFGGRTLSHDIVKYSGKDTRILSRKRTQVNGMRIH